MRRNKYFYWLIGFCLFFTNCSETTVQKERKVISQGVYATKDSFDASRYDLAKSYNNELTRIIPPPASKDRIKITSFDTDMKPASKKKGNSTIPSQRYVVLPDSESNAHVIVANSEEYKQLLSENMGLQKKELATQNAYLNYKKETDETLRLKEVELAKLRARPSFFGEIWNFLTGFLKWGSLGFVIIILGLLIASFFAPGLLKFLFSIFRIIRNILGGIIRFFTWVITVIGNLFKKK